MIFRSPFFSSSNQPDSTKYKHKRILYCYNILLLLCCAKKFELRFKKQIHNTSNTVQVFILVLGFFWLSYEMHRKSHSVSHPCLLKVIKNLSDHRRCTRKPGLLVDYQKVNLLSFSHLFSFLKCLFPA